MCLKIAFRQLCVPLCGRFGPDEGGVAGYVDRIGTKYAAKWGVLCPKGVPMVDSLGQMAGINFQTRSRIMGMPQVPCLRHSRSLRVHGRIVINPLQADTHCRAACKALRLLLWSGIFPADSRNGCPYCHHCTWILPQSAQVRPRE